MLVSLSGRLGHAIQGFIRLLRLTLDLSRVDCYCGLLFRRTTSYYLCAADYKYQVSEEAYRQLDARHSAAFYMLYFTPRSRHLVALEPVLAAEAQETRY